MDPPAPTTAIQPNQAGYRRLPMTAPPKQANATPKNASMPMLQMPKSTSLTAIEIRSLEAASGAAAPAGATASAFMTNPSMALLTVTTALPSKPGSTERPA